MASIVKQVFIISNTIPQPTRGTAEEKAVSKLEIFKSLGVEGKKKTTISITVQINVLIAPEGLIIAPKITETTVMSATATI